MMIRTILIIGMCLLLTGCFENTETRVHTLNIESCPVIQMIEKEDLKDRGWFVYCNDTLCCNLIDDWGACGIARCYPNIQ